jgi:hypothetical protein
MTVKEVTSTISRIMNATPDSPLVVAGTPDPDIFDTFFYNTCYGRRFVESKPPNLVGVFDGTLTRIEVRRKLHDFQYKNRKTAA